MEKKDIKNCYGRKYKKLEHCSTCEYIDFCKESQEAEKVSSSTTGSVQHLDSDADNIFNAIKASNVSGDLIANLLMLSDFNPIAFFIAVCRLGNLTYADIAKFFGVSDVCIFKYCKYKMDSRLHKYLRLKKLTFVELEDALKKYKRTQEESYIKEPVQEDFFEKVEKSNNKNIFKKTMKKMIQLEFNNLI